MQRVQTATLQHILSSVLGNPAVCQLPVSRHRYPVSIQWNNHRSMELHAQGETSVVVVFVAECFCLVLSTYEALQHCVIRQILHENFKERPSRYSYFDRTLGCTLKSPKFVFLETLVACEFLVDVWSDRWKGKTLFDVMHGNVFG